MLSIQRTTVYRHQATVRKLYGVHGSIELMRAIASELATNISELTLTSRGKVSVSHRHGDVLVTHELLQPHKQTSPG